jgi:hypothetical protein
VKPATGTFSSEHSEKNIDAFFLFALANHMKRAMHRPLLWIALPDRSCLDPSGHSRALPDIDRSDTHRKAPAPSRRRSKTESRGSSRPFDSSGNIADSTGLPTGNCCPSSSNAQPEMRDPLQEIPSASDGGGVVTTPGPSATSLHSSR